MTDQTFRILFCLFVLILFVLVPAYFGGRDQ